MLATKVKNLIERNCMQIDTDMTSIIYQDLIKATAPRRRARRTHAGLAA